MKNKEITMYELLELFINNKEPKKIKYGYRILTLKKEKDDYEDKDSSVFFYDILGNSTSIKDFLNKKVEILPEENDEWEDIEELAMLCNENSKDEIMRNRFIINSLIKNQKYLKGRLDKNE